MGLIIKTIKKKNRNSAGPGFVTLLHLLSIHAGASFQLTWNSSIAESHPLIIYIITEQR